MTAEQVAGQANQAGALDAASRILLVAVVTLFVIGFVMIAAALWRIVGALQRDQAEHRARRDADSEIVRLVRAAYDHTGDDQSRVDLDLRIRRAVGREEPSGDDRARALWFANAASQSGSTYIGHVCHQVTNPTTLGDVWTGDTQPAASEFARLAAMPGTRRP